MEREEDITERKRAEEALRESEERLRFALDVIETGEWDLDLIDHSAHRSLKHDQIFGYETLLPQWTYEMFLEHVVPEDRAAVDQKFRQAMESKGDWHFECRIDRRDGVQRWILASGRHCLDFSGQPHRMVGIVQDITERKRAEEALRRNNEELSAANEELAATEEELRNQVEEILAGREALRRKNEELSAANEELAATEEELRSQLEEILTGREALRRQSKFLKTIIDSLTYPLYVINVSDYTIQLANKTLGTNLPEGITCHALTHRSDKPCDGADNPCTIEKTKQSGQPVVLEHTHYDAHGNARYVEIHASPIFDSQGKIVQVIESTIDITERRSMEAQLLQSQKMEAVGRLAGGVAHDFNNVLTAIMGYSELALDALPEDHPEHNHIEEIRNAGERAAALTRQLLAFSRKQIFQPEVLCLNEVVDGMAKMLRRMIPEDVELVTVLDPALERVMLDPMQVEQILMNLAVNARDAMPKGGKLTVETANVELDVAYTKSHPEVQPGNYVMLAVSDTGCGMDRETQAHIFEPFFTTKEKSKGTGLGLSTVYGIVKQSGGSIFVYSEPGKGTAFKIYLPRAEEAPGERGPAAEKRPGPALPQGTETVLVAEDDETIRRMIYEILQYSGYAALEAGRGEEALRLAGEHAGPIHLLITDMVMPGMGGRDLAGRLAALRPGVRVLYVSGYTDDAIVRHGVLEPGLAFLQKPFKPEALLLKVRETLDAPEGPGV
jgi:PAS domain S-box-containing protein